MSVNVQVRTLLPPLEQAPDQIAMRPPLTLSVIDVPTANDAEPRAARGDADAGRAGRDPLAAAAGGRHRQRRRLGRRRGGR